MYKRNVERGPGSNQYQDKPPQAPNPQDIATIRNRHAGAAQGLNGMVEESPQHEVVQPTEQASLEQTRKELERSLWSSRGWDAATSSTMVVLPLVAAGAAASAIAVPVLLTVGESLLHDASASQWVQKHMKRNPGEPSEGKEKRNPVQIAFDYMTTNFKNITHSLKWGSVAGVAAGSLAASSSAVAIAAAAGPIAIVGLVAGMTPSIPIAIVGVVAGMTLSIGRTITKKRHANKEKAYKEQKLSQKASEDQQKIETLESQLVERDATIRWHENKEADMFKQFETMVGEQQAKDSRITELEKQNQLLQQQLAAEKRKRVNLAKTLVAKLKPQRPPQPPQRAPLAERNTGRKRM